MGDEQPLVHLLLVHSGPSRMVLTSFFHYQPQRNRGVDFFFPTRIRPSLLRIPLRSSPLLQN
jgi:hypothetical protein